MNEINTDSVPVPRWATPKHKLDKAFSDGRVHARNHYYGEDTCQDWPDGVFSWAVNPYSENRPGAYYSWAAGFCEEWAELKRNET